MQDCSHDIIGAALEVQKALGVGLLESAYAAALAIELASRGIPYRREVPVMGVYKGQALGVAFRADFVVADSIIVELKAIDGVLENHRAQVLSYLRLTGLRIGLLINFHDFPLSRGIHRLVNQL